MANNWKILDGGVYIAKSSIADNVNAGGQDTPKKTLPSGTIGSKHVLGAGVYRQAVNITNNTQRIVPDGKVIFEGAGVSVFEFNSTGSGILGQIGLSRIIIRNYTSIQLDSTAGGANPATFENVHIYGTQDFQNPESFVAGIGKFSNSIIEGLSNYTGSESPSFPGEGVCRTSGIFKSTCIGINKMNPSLIEDSYIDETSILYYAESQSSSLAGKLNNLRNIFRLRVDGVNLFDYVIQDELTGTPQDNGYAAGVNWLNSVNLQADGMSASNADDWEAAVSGCMNKDPMFNNQSLRDYTIMPVSPHIKAGSAFSNIGGTEVSVNAFYVPSSAAFVSDKLDLDSNYTDLNTTLELKREDVNTEIGTGADNIIGNVSVSQNRFETEFIKYDGQFVKKLGKITPLWDEEYDSDFSTPAAENDNVLRSDLIAADGSAIETPARLTYEMTWDDAMSKPDYEVTPNGNNYYADNRATSGTWLVFELYTQPMVDSAGRGNGDPDYDTTTGAPVECTYYRIRWNQRRDYFVPVI